MYIMLTLAVKSCTLWLHTEPLGWPGHQVILTEGETNEAGGEESELSQHEKLVSVTAKHKHMLLNLGEAPDFQFAVGDDTTLGAQWWDTTFRWITLNVVSYYLWNDVAKVQLRKTIMDTFVKSLSNDLAAELSLLPGSQLVRTSLQDAKKARARQEGAAVVAPPRLGKWAWPVDFKSAVMGFDDLFGHVWALGARTVDCVTIRPASSRYAVTAVPLLDPFPGLPDVPYTLNRDGRPNEPADAITALVLLTWALYAAVHHTEIDYTPLCLVTVHHKATVIEAAGLEWWARGCSCDRAALCLITQDDATAMKQAAADKRFQHRPKKNENSKALRIPRRRCGPSARTGVLHCHPRPRPRTPRRCGGGHAPGHVDLAQWHCGHGIQPGACRW
jgi:hypothetical protein